MEKVRLFSILLAVLFIFSNLSSGEISFVGSGFIPEPNEEITIQIQTDVPLFAMGLGIQITGDANITGGMCEEDCNNFGWDNGWNSDPYIDDANGWVYISGVSWPSEANGIVGYIKFRYNSGQVIISIFSSEAFDVNCQPVGFSQETLVFGEPDANDSNQFENSLEESISTAEDTNSPAEANDVNLPFGGLWQNQQDKHQKKLIYCPADITDREDILSKADYEAITKNELAMDSVEEDDSGQMLMDSEPNVIEINSDITTNQLWTATNIYHITAAVDVQALLVIEPSTLISFSNSGTLYVNNGGTLISVGTPDEPIYYTSDSYSGWSDYYCAIYIEETASPATKIAYSSIDCAYIAIITDNIRLDRPIENNYLFYNSYGVFEYGTQHTDIVNNLIYSSFNNEYYSSGIEVFMASISESADANSYILIQNNTCDYQDYGIVVHGVADENDVGSVMLVNNIITQSYECGLNLVDGYMLAIVSNTGYGANTENKNWEFEEYDPVETTQSPYVSGENYLDVCYLDQNSVFVNAGLEYIEQTQLIGKTTDVNGTPDSNFVDIGFHHPNWDFVNANTGFAISDFNKDTITDYEDLYVLSANWLDTVEPNSNSDLNGDGTVNFKDFTLFANNWQRIQGEPNIIPIISGDPNNGYVDIGFSGWTLNTKRVFLLADGQIIGGTFRLKDGETITIDISKYGNGEKQFKIVSVDRNGHVTCSNITDVDFLRKLNYCVLPKTYERNEPLPFAAYNSGAGDITVKAFANGGTLVWSQTFTGNSINGYIPALITNQYEFDYVSFDNTSGQSLAKKVTDPNLPNFSANIQALIVVPKWKFRIRDYQIVWAVQNAFKYHGIIYALLSGSNATYENVQKYALNKNIKYLYIGCTDGHFLILDYPPSSTDTPDNRRTNFDLYDPQGEENYTPVVSIQRSDYSDPNMAPPWCCDLWFGGLKSVALMGFSHLEFAYFDFCYSGRLKINASNQLIQGQPGQQGVFDIPHSDISFALGMAGSGRDNFYQGWYDKSMSAFAPPPIWETEYQRWSRIEWYQLEAGANLYDALYYVIQQQSWFGPLDPVNCYRLKGEGDMTNVRLRNW